jgi:hypothetical protein
MRMAGPDVVLFIVGALLFGGALTAIIVTEGPEAFAGGSSATGAYTVTYSTASAQVAKTAVADFSAAGSVPAAVNGSNIKSVKVSVECTDSQAGAVAPFSLSVTVKGPGNQTAKKDGTCGTPIVLDFAINPVPGDTSASGPTQADAAASLPKGANDTAARGTWTVSFTGGRGSPAGGLPVQPPGTAPGGNVVESLETYTPKLTAISK